jgi:hypothetical protein
MKPINPVMILLTTAILVASCGLNEKEKSALIQRQKEIDDSIHLADLNRVKEVKKEKSTLSDSLAYYSTLLSQQKNALAHNRASLYTANDQMTQIKSFQLGRLPGDRESQIHNQELYIQTLLIQQDSIQTAIRCSMDRSSQVRIELVSLK